MTTFTISTVKFIGGTALVDAESLEEAKIKGEEGDFYGEELEEPEDEMPSIFGAVLFDDEGNNYV